MSEMTFGQGSSEGESQESGSGVNPAWNTLLEKVPQELHSQIIPDLKSWDQGVQKRFGEVHSKYKPFDEVISGTTPEALQEALGVVQALRANPEMVWRELGQRFGYGQQPQQQQQPQGQGQPDDEMWEGMSPALRTQWEALLEKQRTLEEVSGTMAQIMVNQQQQDQYSKEDQELDQMYEGLMDDPVFGALNQGGEAEPYINSLLQAELTPEQALERFHGFVEHVLKTAGRPAVPRILGPGGQIPSTNIDIKKASPQDVRALVANMIAEGNAAAE